MKEIIIKGRIKKNIRDFKRDPKKQYFNHLEKLLNVRKLGNVTKKEIFEYVKKWYYNERENH